MDFEDIRVETDGAIGVVSFARGDRNNTLRPQTLRELCTALDELGLRSDVHAILLRADGKHFSAGADFDFLQDLTQTKTTAVRNDIYSHFQGAARRLYHFEKPTVALVNGAAITVGCELALACDFRLATDSTRFQESWIKLGLMPPLGGMFLLPRIVGLGRAAQMTLRGEAIGGAAALAAGLVSEIVAPENLDARGLEVARELAELPPLAYAAVKKALQRGLETTMDAEWSANVQTQAVLISSDDFREGLAAARERRQASFRGT
ncbi:MAG: enoyl-CoA hydratase/isomerase family protein [Hyphomonadaceae bacterium]|nr:enoyl-CoA hydratase/isomerase family protein [Hyphomonadaceae bacterium]